MRYDGLQQDDVGTAGQKLQGWLDEMGDPEARITKPVSPRGLSGTSPSLSSTTLQGGEMVGSPRSVASFQSNTSGMTSASAGSNASILRNPALMHRAQQRYAREWATMSDRARRSAVEAIVALLAGCPRLPPQPLTVPNHSRAAYETHQPQHEH